MTTGLDLLRLQPATLTAGMHDIEPVLNRLHIDFYVVGAVARDIWLTYEGTGPSRRMTRDVDLAISLADEAAYEHLLTALVATGRFSTNRSSAFALTHTPTSTVVDLLPFGSLAGPDGTVRVSGAGLETISTVGFAEMAAAAVVMRVAGGNRVWRIVSLPALLLLKLYGR